MTLSPLINSQHTCEHVGDNEICDFHFSAHVRTKKNSCMENFKKSLLFLHQKRKDLKGVTKGIKDIKNKNLTILIQN